MDHAPRITTGTRQQRGEKRNVPSKAGACRRPVYERRGRDMPYPRKPPRFPPLSGALDLGSLASGPQSR